MGRASKVATAWATNTLVFFVGTAAALLYLGAGDPGVEEEEEDDHHEDDGANLDAAKVKALVDKKQRLRQRALAMTPEEAARKKERAEKLGLPEGQILARKWIVLDLGYRPTAAQYDLGETSWSLEIELDAPGKKVALTLADLEPHAQSYEDVTWNCVTGWSTKGLRFQGVPVATLLEIIESKVRDEHGADAWRDDWRWLFQSSPEGYTVPAHREDIMDGFLAISKADGGPLDMDHGGIRFVFPQLFGWKSCKWVSKLAFVPKFRKGWWERVACHPRGRVAFNERWAPGAGAFWTFLSKCNMMYLQVFGEAFAPVMQISGQLLARLVDLFKMILRLHNDQ